jgi:hypothetical protein
MNMVQIMCTHVSKLKSDTCWNCSRNQGIEDEREQWKGWIQVWYIWYIVKIFVNATMHPHLEQYKKKKRTKNPRLLRSYFSLFLVLPHYPSSKNIIVQEEHSHHFFFHFAKEFWCTHDFRVSHFNP